MSKKTTTKTSKSTKAAAEPSSNDKARADALAKLNAKPDKNATKRSTKAVTKSAAKPAPKATTKLTAKRLSALDAAAQVLQGLPVKEAKSGLSSQDLIDRMAAAGLWTSPGGQTPAATLYAAMIREIASKGGASRFVRLESADGSTRGRFAASGDSPVARASENPALKPRRTTSAPTKAALAKSSPTRPTSAKATSQKGGA